MSLIEYTHTDGDDYVTENITTDTQTAEIYGHIPYCVFVLTLQNGRVLNNGTDTESVTVSVRDGLAVARGAAPSDATVLDYSGDVMISVDGVETTKTFTNGTVSFELTTEKPAGSEIQIVSEPLADHPAERDSMTIEVVNA